MSIYFHWEGCSPDVLASALKQEGITAPIWVEGSDYDPEQVEFAVVWAAPERRLADFVNLKYVFSIGAGVTHITDDPTFDTTIPIVRLQDDMLVLDMSCHILHWVLHFHRHYAHYRHDQAAKTWQRLQYPDNAERRIAVLGLGQTGLDACARLRDLGFDVTGWSRSAKELEGVTCLAGDAAFDQVLGKADILVNLLPLTPETTDILDAAAFAKMPDGAFVINCSRGASIVDADLLAALKDGKLAAAALDVFRSEPLPHDSPYWTHPDVYVTPHAAAPTNERSAARFFAKNIRAVLDGGTPTPIVDLKRGY